MTDASVSCAVCGTSAEPDDHFCSVCGALLPDPPRVPPQLELDLERLFSHRGRTGRLEFFLTAVLLSLFLLIALGLLSAMIGNILGIVLGGALTVAAGFALACATIKRLHDIDTTGWPAVIGLIPVIGWVFIVVLALIGPSQEPNSYGLPRGGSICPIAPAASTQ